MALTTATRTQFRATCPCCFAQQAVNTNGKLANHGYTRPQAWHQNIGTCLGAGAPHFGTEAGRRFTSELATNLRRTALQLDREQQEVLAGTATVYGTKRINGKAQQVVIAVPTLSQVQFYAAQLGGRATANRRAAGELDTLVTAWTPQAPIAVEVEKATGPLVHLRGNYYDPNAHACAASAMAAQQDRPTTTNLAEVTCTKCQQRAAARTANGWPITRAR